MIPKTEQWKLNGDCDKCRRAEFCRKSCTARKKANARLLRRATEAIIDSCLPEPFANETKKWNSFINGGKINENHSRN